MPPSPSPDRIFASPKSAIFGISAVSLDLDQHVRRLRDRGGTRPTWWAARHPEEDPGADRHRLLLLELEVLEQAVERRPTDELHHQAGGALDVDHVGDADHVPPAERALEPALLQQPVLDEPGRAPSGP